MQSLKSIFSSIKGYITRAIKKMSNKINRQILKDSDEKTNRKNPRPYARTPILTTDKSTFSRALRMRPGQLLKVEAVNDIVSSAKCGQSTFHHMIRRSALFRRQLEGGYLKARIRTTASDCIDCILLRLHPCSDDSCSFYADITRPESRTALSKNTEVK